MSEPAADLDVRYFQVIETRTEPQTQCRAHVPVGPMFETPEQGREYLRRIRPQRPNTRLTRAEWYVDPRSEEELRFREEILGHIVPADEWGAEAFGLLPAHTEPHLRFAT